ncbi:MAG: hypothetical protein HZR80_15235 [Candidatus Heimdallarchaeota archaeon]
MVKARRYIRPRIVKAENELRHILDEATLLVSALILQQAGTNPDRFRTFDIKKASIDSLYSVLFTLKSFIKKKLHFLDELIDNMREDSLQAIIRNKEFAKVITHTLQLNLIADNNDIALYLSPYIDNWDLLTAGVQSLIINHVIKSINNEIERARLSEKLSKKF